MSDMSGLICRKSVLSLRLLRHAHAALPLVVSTFATGIALPASKDVGTWLAQTVALGGSLCHGMYSPMQLLHVQMQFVAGSVACCRCLSKPSVRTRLNDEDMKIDLFGISGQRLLRQSKKTAHKRCMELRL